VPSSFALVPVDHDSASRVAIDLIEEEMRRRLPGRVRPSSLASGMTRASPTRNVPSGDARPERSVGMVIPRYGLGGRPVRLRRETFGRLAGAFIRLRCGLGRVDSRAEGLVFPVDTERTVDHGWSSTRVSTGAWQVRYRPLVGSHASHRCHVAPLRFPISSLLAVSVHPDLQ
jgi:hypothetical protein